MQKHRGLRCSSFAQSATVPLSVTGTQPVNWRWIRRAICRGEGGARIEDENRPLRTRLKWYRSCRSREAAVNRDRVGVRSYLPCCPCPMNNGGNKTAVKGIFDSMLTNVLSNASGNFIPISFSLFLSLSLLFLLFSTRSPSRNRWRRERMSAGSRSETRLRKL